MFKDGECSVQSTQQSSILTQEEENDPATALVLHSKKTGHYPDFKNASIVDFEAFLPKRLTLVYTFIVMKRTIKDMIFNEYRSRMPKYLNERKTTANTNTNTNSHTSHRHESNLTFHLIPFHATHSPHRLTQHNLCTIVFRFTIYILLQFFTYFFIILC